MLCLPIQLREGPGVVKSADVSLFVKGRLCRATVRFVLLYECETWSLHQDVHRLQVFGQCCLRQLAMGEME